MIRLTLLSLGALVLCASSAMGQSDKAPATPRSAFVTALSFVHQFGTPAALAPGNDRQLKATLQAALSEKPPELSGEEVGEVFDKAVFDRWAGTSKVLTMSRLEELMQTSTPKSREEIFGKVREHADLL